MSAKKAIKTANICANIYEGEFMLSFECVGVESCVCALCHIMPPDGSESCTYSDHGSCVNPAAQIKAMAFLKNKLARELSKLEDAE